MLVIDLIIGVASGTELETQPSLLDPIQFAVQVFKGDYRRLEIGAIALNLPRNGKGGDPFPPMNQEDLSPARLGAILKIDFTPNNPPEIGWGSVARACESGP